MEQLLGQLLTLGWCWAALGVLYLAWLGSGVLNVAYNRTRKWSWQIFWEDLLKLLTLGGSMVAFVVGVNLISWLVWRMGGDISGLAEDVSTAGLLALMVKAGLGYASKAFANYKQFIAERHSEPITVELDEIDYAGVIADTEAGVKAIADAITPEHTVNDKQTDETANPSEAEIEEAIEVGQGSEALPINRILTDGDNDNGKGWQCSKYSWYLASGIRMNYVPHPDYGPCNGDKMIDYLIQKLGWVECAKMDGAIFGYKSGAYDHTGIVKNAKQNLVNDANWQPLKVGTHYLNLEAVGARYACPKAMLVNHTIATEKAPEKANTAVSGGVSNKPVSTPSQDKPLIFHKGEKVVPLRKVDYDGRHLRQYDDTYYVVQDVEGGQDRVVLGARGQIWAAMNIKDIKRV